MCLTYRHFQSATCTLVFYIELSFSGEKLQKQTKTLEKDWKCWKGVENILINIAACLSVSVSVSAYIVKYYIILRSHFNSRCFKSR